MIRLVPISSSAKNLVEAFERAHQERLGRLINNPKYTQYGSIEDILAKKYGVMDIDKKDFSDFRNKTTFLDNRGRITTDFLTYSQADKIIESALQELP